MDKKDIKMRGIFLVMLCIAAMAQAAAKDDVFSWYDGGPHISYSLSKSVSPVVTTAIQMWGEDMMDVTGAKLKKEGNDAKVRIVQMDKDKAAEKSLKAAGIDVETLKRRKDAFCIKVTGNQLIVAGGNGRGTAYGILELSRMAGVSPWKWWADEMPEKRKRLEVPADFHTEQSPSVEYRGIFINDEDWSTQPWSWRTFSPARPGMISAVAYKQVFKLLMRLRANAIWPAMHESSIPFFLIPGAKEAADSCGIVIGTSHCEPMMRNNAGEWNTKERGAYNYIKNKEIWHIAKVSRNARIANIKSK